MKFQNPFRSKPEKKPEEIRFALSRSPLADVSKIIENVPISWIQQGRISKKDILTAESHEYNPKRISAKVRLQEADLALAATTPVLGQYAPTFGWPEWVQTHG